MKEKRKGVKQRQIAWENEGITLVALVITIIIIIILATVTINMAFGDNGLIKQAQLAKDLTANSMSYEEGAMANLVAYMNTAFGIGGSGEIEPPTPGTNEMTPPPVEEPPKVEEIKGGEAFDKKTTVEDAEGNKIVVPAGFKIASDSGNTVQQGIVIEDVSASTDSAVQGSQFVWIPVGVFTKDGGAPSNEIILGRYTFGTDSQGTPTLQQAAYTKEADGSYADNYTMEKGIFTNGKTYIELATYRVGTASSGLNGLNATAYNLKDWIDSVKENGGYYIGRYEASYASGTSTTDYKAATKVSNGYSEDTMSYSKGTLWNFITQLDASKVAINTYADSISVKSDLMNSYAWDTAIVFIQECGHTNYANQVDASGNLTDTGTGQDEVCKINGMASNILEWTTEYCNYKLNSYANPCAFRGGVFYSSALYTAYRGNDSATGNNYNNRFPPHALFRCLKSMFFT